MGQVEHLKVSYKTLLSPIGTLMLLVMVKSLRLSLTSFISDDSLTNLAVRFLLMKGVINSSSELEEDIDYTRHPLLSFKSESFTT